MSCVYFVACETSPLIKVGVTTKFVKQRVSSLQSGCPFRLSLIDFFDGARETEMAIHAALLPYHAVGEWYEGEAVQRFLKDVHLRTLPVAIERWTASSDAYFAGVRAKCRSEARRISGMVQCALDELIARDGLEGAATAIGEKPCHLKRGHIEMHGLLNLTTAIPERGMEILRELLAPTEFERPAL